MKKTNILLLLNLIVLSSCNENKRLHRLEIHLNSFISKQEINKNVFTLELDTISSFEWDELLISSPYTNLNKSYRDYDFSEFPNISESINEKFILLGFINKKKGVRYVELKRSQALGLLSKSSKKIFNKSESKFILHN